MYQSDHDYQRDEPTIEDEQDYEDDDDGSYDEEAPEEVHDEMTVRHSYGDADIEDGSWSGACVCGWQTRWVKAESTARAELILHIGHWS